VLTTRIKTAAIALPALLALVLLAPPEVFTAFIIILAAWALYEVAAMTDADVTQGILLALCGGIPLGALLLARGDTFVVPALVIAAMAILVTRVGASGSAAVKHGTWQIVLGALWVGVLFPYFALLRNGPNGVALTIMMLLIVVASDSGAYFAGKAIGRVKLLPKVSPNKTVEGAIAGLIASLIAGLILRRWLTPNLTASLAAFLAVCVSLLAQLGDLANSAFKRVAGVKDSGWLFPGHGGLLDRACSLVFAAVFTYYYVRISGLG